ncbi:DUF4367 domain-containing protein [Ihubacter sp. mB4P-1]|uniref:DUF4367 domain-containing protein n=1 Tax=Ihubacter sp. mB4P-1 TaxID=3242370 RepID=UPI00137B5FA9
MGSFKIWKKEYSADEVLKEVAKLSKEEIVEENKEYLKKTESIDEIFPMLEPDQSFLAFARAYDRKANKRKVTEKRKRILQVAAVFLVCITTMTAIAVEISEAFRVRFYSLFTNETDGSVTLLTEREQEIIGEWEDYWYPTYVPDGFQMVAAEKRDNESVIVFESNDRKISFRIMEFPFNVAISHDTDTNTVEEVRIGYYKGYLFEDVQNQSIDVYWLTDDKQLVVAATGEMDKETVIKIAESLEYRRGKK